MWQRYGGAMHREGSSPSRRLTSRLARENINRIKETKQERNLKLCQEKRVLIA